MGLVALDLNANRVWGLSGDAGQQPQLVHLDGDRPELPLVLSLEKRAIEIGRQGAALSRRSPHLVCQGFLPKLGEACAWHYHRHRVDAAKALTLVFEKIRHSLPSAGGIVLGLPGYLSRTQLSEVARLARLAGLSITGVITRVLAAGLHTYAEHAWHNVGVLVDIDDHALICAVLRPVDNELRSLGHRLLPALGLRLWKEKLLGWIADHCVRTSRRDPRESPEADQMLFDQMDQVFDGCSQNKPVSIRVEAAQWFQTLTVQPAEATAACAALSQRAAEQVAAALAWAEQQMTSATIYFTARAAQLPGLAAAVYRRCENKAPVVVLPPAAPARAAFDLAVRIDQGECAPGIYDLAVPLPVRERAETPPVIPFREQPARRARK